MLVIRDTRESLTGPKSASTAVHVARVKSRLCEVTFEVQSLVIQEED